MDHGIMDHGSWITSMVLVEYVTCHFVDHIASFGLLIVVYIFHVVYI